jgi:N-acetylglucosamine malate deacetylase 1
VRTVLVLAPHPDDAEIAMGGTMAALVAQGWRVVVCDLTDGEPTPVGSPERRRREAERAARILGVERRILDLPNRFLLDGVQERKKVAAVIREVRPEWLFVPYWEDAHPDHVQAASLCEAARFYAKLTHTDIPKDPYYPRRVVHFFSTHYRMVRRPSFVFDVSETLERKMESLRAYESQFGAERGNQWVLEAVRDAARYSAPSWESGTANPSSCGRSWESAAWRPWCDGSPAACTTRPPRGGAVRPRTARLAGAGGTDGPPPRRGVRAGEPLGRLRPRPRAELVQRASELLGRWDVPVPEASPSGPWVVTGHQPTLFHPGIWIKTWGVNACCARGAVGVNVVVDSDACEAWKARVPRRNGTLHPVERSLVAGGPEVPFEALPPPEEAAWRSFCGQLREDLATLQAPALLDRLSLAEEVGVRCLPRVRHLGEFGAALRRRLENASAPVRYLEVTTSELARTEAFRRFAGWIVQDAEWFWTCHNGALDRYRREHGLRSAAQPFPNLRRQDGLVELPFWAGAGWPETLRVDAAREPARAGVRGPAAG